MSSNPFKPVTVWVHIVGREYEGWLSGDYETDIRLFASQDAAHDFDEKFNAKHGETAYTEIFKAKVFWTAEQAQMEIQHD